MLANCLKCIFEPVDVKSTFPQVIYVDGGVAGDNRFLLVVTRFIGVGVEIIGCTCQSFPAYCLFSQFNPLWGEHGGFYQSLVADFGLFRQFLQILAGVRRQGMASMEQTAQYTPFGAAPVVTVTYESIFAECLQNTDKCFSSIDVA